MTDSSIPGQIATKTFSVTIAAATLASIAVTPVNPDDSGRGHAAVYRHRDVFRRQHPEPDRFGNLGLSNTGVATITSAGLATAVSAGSTSISATLSGITGSTTLTVSPATLAITTSSLANGTQNVGYSATLAASGGRYRMAGR